MGGCGHAPLFRSASAQSLKVVFQTGFINQRLLDMYFRPRNCARQNLPDLKAHTVKMPLPRDGKGMVYLRLTPDADSSTRNAPAARCWNRLQHDTSELEGAGAWVRHDENNDFETPMRDSRLPLSPSPTHVRPKLHWDTHSTTPLSYLGAKAPDSGKLSSQNGSRYDSPHSSSSSKHGSDYDDSLSLENFTGEEDIFVSAQSSPVWNNFSSGSPGHSLHDHWTAEGVQHPHPRRTGPIVSKHLSSDRVLPRG